MVMSQIAMELEEKAAELGFESLQQALDAGCEVEYGSDGNSELVEPLVAAHRAWEKEKEKVLGYIRDITDMLEDVYQDETLYKKAVEVQKFIKEAHE